MSIDNLDKIQQLASEINNFKECYKDAELHGDMDGHVSAEVVLDCMMEHPYLQGIANNIAKLYADVKR